MKNVDELNRRLSRLQKWSDRYDRLLEREARQLEGVFVHAAAEWETAKKETMESFIAQEADAKSKLDQAGKEYAQTKYRLERDSSAAQGELRDVEQEFADLGKKYGGELNKINEEKTNFLISMDRQKSALTDLYQEKMRHLTVTRAGLLQQYKGVEEKVKAARAQADKDLATINEEGSQKIEHLKEHAASKREGWRMALEAIHKELDAFKEEKDHIAKRLTEIKDDKEKELNAARLSMAVAREQLEVDKATLIEKAEEDERRCAVEVENLKVKIESSERDLQDYSLAHEKAKKDAEEAFLKEETMLKEAVRTESEKRDYEQKLYEQERATKEKELNRLREEYEKKKWHWDNQIRSLMMQKAVQDSEFEAERLRVDREARTILRGLEAKRDELKQRLAEIKNRHESLSANAQKEHQLINQRWHWRRDRLWALWQSRLETLRKERAALHEQIEALQSKFEKERNNLTEVENRESHRADELQGFVIQIDEKNKGHRKQKEIQIELEKTRVLAQIKECETLITDWTERLKKTSDELSQSNTTLATQVNYLDRWYREEEKETQLFLHNLQAAMSVIESFLDQFGFTKAA